MNIEDLKPNPKNPRKITDKKLKALKKSLEEFGDLGGIIYNKRTGQLIGGHQRVAAMRLGAISFTDENWGWIHNADQRFALRLVDWDEDKEKAANIAANKGAGDWDWPMLTEWFHELDSSNFDLGLTMFSESEIESALGLKEDKSKDSEKSKSGKKRAVTCPECDCEFEIN